MRTVVLVHGMGTASGDEFRDEFIKASEESLAMYKVPTKWDKSTGVFSVNRDGGVWEETRVVSFGYDWMFEDRREAIGNTSQSVADRLKTIGLNDRPATSFVEAIEGIGRNFGKDKFFNTHFGDVMMYAFTVVGEQVRVSLAEKLTGLMESDTPPGSVHVVGHSLGTAVVHDTLSMLYASTKDRKKPQLNLRTHKLGSVHLIANVSKILDFYVPVDDSYLRPGAGGCTRFYYQYNHSLDPFTKVSPFEPDANDGWVDPLTYQLQYIDVSTNDITGGNPHGIGHYIRDPKNSEILFNAIYGVDLVDVLPDAEKAFKKLTFSVKAKAAKKAIKNVKVTSGDSVDNMVEALQELSKFLKAIKAEWTD